MVDHLLRVFGSSDVLLNGACGSAGGFDLLRHSLCTLQIDIREHDFHSLP
jgi:hypothetical protein